MNTRPKGAFRYTAKHIADIQHAASLLSDGSVHNKRLFFAERLNALLEAEEAKCERVYFEESDSLVAKAKFKHVKDTHTALLWNVEKINKCGLCVEGKPCNFEGCPND